MKNRLSILAALFFLGLLMAPSFYWMAFLYQRHQVREEMEKRMEAEALTTVHVSKLHWFKKDKEIVVNGHLFDVKSITKIASGGYIVTGLFDTQEQQLHQSLDAAVNKKFNTESTASVLLMHSLFSFFRIDEPSLEPVNSLLLYDNICEWKQEKLPASFSKIILPPPEFL